MTRELSGRSIFLASPRDLEAERQNVRDTVVAFNENYALNDDVVFIVKGWEPLARGVGNPQSLINPEIVECDFMVLLLGDYWGSAPSTDGPYSSGTEEEFHKALELLASDDAAMRDLLVVFKVLEPDRMRDPGPQLTKVLSFRNQLESTKQVFYGTFDSQARLKEIVERSLRKWKMPLDPRQPVHIDLSNGSPIMGVESNLSTSELVENATQKAEAGLVTQAELTFSLAVKDREPEALSEFANFMRRTGRLESALELNRELLSSPAILISVEAQDVAYRVNSLANIGLIERKKGNLNASVKYLTEAVNTADLSQTPVPEELAYSLDNLGYTWSQLGDLQQSRNAFERSRAVRISLGQGIESAQSLVNRGRLSIRSHDFEQAASDFDAAIALLDPDRDGLLLANALSGKGKALFESRALDEAVTVLTRALEVNLALGNSDGASIAHGLIARAHLEKGDVAEAAIHAAATAAESEASGNLTGAATGLWVLAQVDHANGEAKSASDRFGQAIDLAQRANNNGLLLAIRASRARLET